MLLDLGVADDQGAMAAGNKPIVLPERWERPNLGEAELGDNEGASTLYLPTMHVKADSKYDETSSRDYYRVRGAAECGLLSAVHLSEYRGLALLVMKKNHGKRGLTGN